MLIGGQPAGNVVVVEPPADHRNHAGARLGRRVATSRSRIPDGTPEHPRRWAGSPTSSTFRRRTSSTTSSSRSWPNGVAGGSAAATTAPAQPTLRQQMAVFLLKGKHGICYVPPRAPASSPTCPAPRRSPTGSRRSPPKASPEAAAPATTARRTRSAATRWPSSCSRPKHGSGYVPPPCTGVFADVPARRPSPTGSSSWPPRTITGGCGGGNYCPGNPNTRGQMARVLTVQDTFQTLRSSRGLRSPVESPVPCDTAPCGRSSTRICRSSRSRAATSASSATSRGRTSRRPR